MNRRTFVVVVDSEGNVLVYGYELHQDLGAVHEVAEGQWRPPLREWDGPYIRRCAGGRSPSSALCVTGGSAATMSCDSADRLAEIHGSTGGQGWSQPL